MRTLVERCCGLDVHQEMVVAFLLLCEAGKPLRQEGRTWSTTTRDLEAMRDWLKAEKVSHVGLESTGVYWRPIYAVLDGHFVLIVGNAWLIKTVPGRKTDVKDAAWIADLVRHGLIAPSYVPPQPLRELRDLLRYRRKLVEGRASERNRLLKLLETANIKLASVATSLACPASPSSRRLWLARPRPCGWRTWPGGRCARSALTSSGRWRERLRSTTAF